MPPHVEQTASLWPTVYVLDNFCALPLFEHGLAVHGFIHAMLPSKISFRRSTCDSHNNWGTTKLGAATLLGSGLGLWLGFLTLTLTINLFFGRQLDKILHSRVAARPSPILLRRSTGNGRQDFRQRWRVVSVRPLLRGGSLSQRSRPNCARDHGQRHKLELR